MSSVWGRNIKISIFGTSHGAGIGVVIDNLPAGIVYDEPAVLSMLARRAPGGELATARKESDTPEIISGIYNGLTDGSPVCAVIRNSDTHSSDYTALRNTPRPSHADFPAAVKYGAAVDLRGGGHFSGRLTAPLTFAGALCYGHLKTLGITVFSHLIKVGNATAPRYDALFPQDSREYINSNMRAEIESARNSRDSVGGEIECAVTGLPIGLGGHMFDGVEGTLSSLLFAIPAVKGVGFGDGFGFAERRGSSVNDGYRRSGGETTLASNHCGGVVGGMTTGAPLIFSVAMKPTPSIYLPQESVDLSTGENTIIDIKGRHDPCVALRALPVVEAAAALAIADLLFAPKSKI